VSLKTVSYGEKTKFRYKNDFEKYRVFVVETVTRLKLNIRHWILLKIRSCIMYYFTVGDALQYRLESIRWYRQVMIKGGMER